MKLYFCPAYSGFVYRDLSHIMFNEKIVNSEGLVDLLALHAGLSKVKKSTSERLIEYYKAVSEYIKNNPNNILAKSFQIDPISVSLECLKWRDTLCSAGWSKNSRNVGKRIEVLSGIEEYFSGASISENITELIDAVKCGCNLPENLEIETPFDWKIFPPLEVMLLEELQKRGVKISVFDYKEKPRNNLSRVVGVF